MECTSNFCEDSTPFEVKIHLKCQASLWFAFDVKIWGFLCTWNPPHFQVDSTSNICKCHLFSDLTFHAGIQVLYTYTFDLNSINNESYLIYSDNESHSERPNVIETLRALNKLSVNLETQSNPIINRLMFTVYLYVKSVSSPEPWIRFYT